MTPLGSYSDRFHALHAPGAPVLVLPNVWDAMTARLAEAGGAVAVATTSAGLAWALGYPDGQRVPRDEAMAQLARITRAVRIPVTADVESGYGSGTPDDAALTASAVVRAGAVGINLEDGPGPDGAPVVTAEYHAERLRAARAAAGDALFINARTDTYVRRVGDDASRFDETVRRAHMYLEAGANGIFVPLAPVEVLTRLSAAIPAPLNVIGGPGTPSVSELAGMGVRRITVGPGLARSVMAHVQRSVAELLGAGTFTAITEQVSSPDANALFAPRP